MYKFILIFLFSFLSAGGFTIGEYLNNDKDIHLKELSDLKVYSVSLNTPLKWKATLIESNKKGVCFFIPHDNENASFITALYAIRKYGGSILAIESNEHRYFKGIDPNRYFSNNEYTESILSIIDFMKVKNYPIITLHNNKNGWKGNGGKGTISINKKSKNIKSYFSSLSGRLSDEDSLIYLAGINSKPNLFQRKLILNSGLNFKYEIVRNSDKSLSNYLALFNKNILYINIESEERDFNTQKRMLDIIFNILITEGKV